MLNTNAIYKTSQYKETFRMKKERRKKTSYFAKLLFQTFFT